MAKRLFDIFAAAVGLLLTSPLIAIAAIGVRLCSSGPAFYRAQRVGRGGKAFTLYKLRSMHLENGHLENGHLENGHLENGHLEKGHLEKGQADAGSRITAAGDARVFAFGALLRKSKIDELPQLWNVLRGEMSVVGPRPEDVEIVASAYGPLGQETLRLRPGLAGVSSLYNYTHGERLLSQSDDDTERAYIECLLPIKLALEVVYIRRASLRYDIRLIFRTLATLAWTLTGRTDFPEPPEMEAARVLLDEQRFATAA